jgi:hypothetical protein
VAEIEGRIVGFAIADLQDHSIWALFVHPDYEGRGIGRTLHDIMLSWYFSQTSETVWLGTEPGTRAEVFYKKAGWKVVGMKEKGEVRMELGPNWAVEYGFRIKPYNLLYTEAIDSGLGQFELRIESTTYLVSQESRTSSTFITSAGHQIVLKCLTAPVDRLPCGMYVDKSEAWLFYITKVNGVPEQLQISLCLSKDSEPILGGGATGQYLVAVEFENGLRQVHIGALDEEALSGLDEALWMPKRLIQPLNCEEIMVTAIHPNGLVSQVPELFESEGFYLHYVMAESPLRKSQTYPDEWDISTWFAVDQSKKALERAWLQQTKED